MDRFSHLLYINRITSYISIMNTLLCHVVLVLLIHVGICYDFPPADGHHNLYPYGPPDATVPYSDDDPSDGITIPPFEFFGVEYTTIYININGGISFGEAYDSYTSTPFPLEDEPPIIASYLTDLHTERNHSLVAEIYHREDTTPDILQRASDDIHDYYGDYYSSFTATWTYLITHHRMTTYYYEGEPEDAPEATIQIVLISDGDWSFCKLNYGTLEYAGNEVEEPAQVGYDAGDGINSFNHELSFTPEVQTLQGTSLTYRIDSNSDSDYSVSMHRAARASSTWDQEWGSGEEVNECNDPLLNLCADSCRDTDDSFFCFCTVEGEVLADDGYQCVVAVDECADDTLNNCEDICEDLNVGFQCSCGAAGFMINTTDNVSCIDFDECVGQTHGCSDFCINGVGSYTCACEGGYHLEQNGKTCTDTDECALDSKNNCYQRCVNQEGSYFCTCNQGYKLTDGGTCQVDVQFYAMPVVILAVCCGMFGLTILLVIRY